MEITFSHIGISYSADLSRPLDISIPLKEGEAQVNCFYAPLYETAPVRADSFVGSTREGGSVNFLNIRLNPHGNGTHTECAGHISKEIFTINQSLTSFHYFAKLVSIFPVRLENGDRVILKKQLQECLAKDEVTAIVIRTLPNGIDKQTRNHSGSNPPYVHHEAVQYLVDCGIQHLLLDLPSVDRESDGGKLLAHKTFWAYPGTIAAGRQNCTITELIYVPEGIKDGLYLLNIQIASFEIDASPSKPVLYMLNKRQ